LRLAPLSVGITTIEVQQLDSMFSAGFDGCPSLP